MMARVFELFGGVFLASGLCLGLFLRFPIRARYLPDAIASIEVAIGLSIFGGILIWAGQLVQRRTPKD